MILNPIEMKELFLEVLKRAKGKYAFQVENFCIMGNHYHLMIRPKNGTSLSRIMQWVMSVFAMAYNRIHGLVGHVWGERFYSCIVSGLRDFLRIYKYIDDNPVKAGQVDYGWYWPYGGMWHHRANITDVCSPPGELVELLFQCHSQRMFPLRVEY